MLEVRDVTKLYGPLRALDDVSATFLPGEIHAVLGENGAGKSTLMGVIAGFVSPTRGEVILDGQPQSASRKHKTIEMIHQHFTLVPEFTVAENLALAHLPTKGPINPEAAAQNAFDIAKGLNWDLDPMAKVRNLPVGTQQRVEILKALAGSAEVLVFDEPTAVLSPDEVQDLFRVLKALRDQGKTVLLIAHKLSEITSVADRVTVLRRGKVVASVTLSETNEQQLAEWMVGEMPAQLGKSSPAPTEQPVVTVQNLSAKGDRGEIAVRGVSFEIRPGEILGFGGVDGNGQVELAEALADVRPSQGTLKTPPNVGYIPQDRQADGLAMGMSVQDNLLIGTDWRPPKGARERAIQLIDRFEIRVDGPNDSVAGLSGGNQQKVIVSRTLDRSPQFLIASCPTRGLDIRATEYVHRKILEARDAGAAIALFSTDVDELAALADRVVFMTRGQLQSGTDAESLVGGSA